MLEQKELTVEERRKYKEYNANLIYKFATTFFVVRRIIKLCGLPAFLKIRDNEKVSSDGRKSFSYLSLDEKMEIIKIIEQNYKSTDEQLAKEAFKISEYYPR